MGSALWGEPNLVNGIYQNYLGNRQSWKLFFFFLSELLAPSHGSGMWSLKKTHGGCCKAVVLSHGESGGEPQLCLLLHPLQTRCSSRP